MANSKVFSLKDKGLKLTTAEDIEPHIQALKENSDVEEVVFVGNTLGIGASEALAKVLETKKNLKIANFADIFTSRLLSEIPEALDHILKALLTLPKLETVDLSDNAFGLNTQAPLVSFLAAHTPLRHLYLNNNGLGPAAGTLIADALSTLADKKAAARSAGADVPSLETVICGRNRLENGSMEAWARAYSKHTGLREIKMVQNGIRQEGITHLLRHGLAHQSQIRILDLQDNTFTKKGGARALAAIVAGFPHLRELGVSDCFLQAKGSLLLAAALAKGNNPQLEIVRIQYNDMNAAGLKGFADAAENALPKLRRLEVNGNRFGEDDESVERLQEMFAARQEEADSEFVEALKEGYEFGLDELDELDDESEDEEEEEEEEEEEVKENVLKKADEAEAQNVSEKQDKSVDELANMLGKTGL
ncbi:ran gtpase activating protein 1 [Diplodia corticola]|uniref:Ran gtpase activating protein 1 n=1 Tax=Diplodia corticola TaxID=236234 RepID=A0A1J9RMK7_9PEZI|nr:ran gtpase activating protein 1 [Diplodia corticola]OJD33811.1 ran gtpase activating protein 1 [Diplodia corticola]